MLLVILWLCKRLRLTLNQSFEYLLLKKMHNPILSHHIYIYTHASSSLLKDGNPRDKERKLPEMCLPPWATPSLKISFHLCIQPLAASSTLTTLSASVVSCQLIFFISSHWLRCGLFSEYTVWISTVSEWVRSDYHIPTSYMQANQKRHQQASSNFKESLPPQNRGPVTKANKCPVPLKTHMAFHSTNTPNVWVIHTGQFNLVVT